MILRATNEHYQFQHTNGEIETASKFASSFSRVNCTTNTQDDQLDGAQDEQRRIVPSKKYIKLRE